MTTVVENSIPSPQDGVAPTVDIKNIAVGNHTPAFFRVSFVKHRMVKCGVCAAILIEDDELIHASWHLALATVING